MKSQVFHENKVMRSVDLAVLLVTMSFFTLYGLKSSGIFSGFQVHSVTNESLRIEMPVEPGEPAAVTQEKSAVTAEFIAYGANSGSLGLVKQAASAFNFSTITGYLEPVEDEELKLEEWMVNPSVWFPAEIGSEGFVKGTVVESDDGSAVVAAMESTTIFPARMAGYLAEENEPAAVLESWMTDESKWDMVAVSGEASGAVAGMQDREVFDTQGYLIRLISLNESLAEEKDPPLRLESWMVNDRYFNSAPSSPGVQKGKARRLNRKAAF